MNPLTCAACDSSSTTRVDNDYDYDTAHIIDTYICDDCGEMYDVVYEAIEKEVRGL